MATDPRMLPPDAYLQPYGFAVQSSRAWGNATSAVGHPLRLPLDAAAADYPGSVHCGWGERPSLRLDLEGHQELSGHTFYCVLCRLDGGRGQLAWRVERRLNHLREGLYKPVLGSLRGAYSRLFSEAPFALRGGPSGTSLRLTRWLKKLAECVNSQEIDPTLAAVVLQFLEAPRLPEHDLALNFLQQQQQQQDDEPGSREALASPPRDRRSAAPPPGTPAAALAVRYQARIQDLFLQEVGCRFECESAERSLELRARGRSGVQLLADVVRCLVENLEDVRVRMEARGQAWDPDAEAMVPLDAESKRRVHERTFSFAEESLLSALRSAAALSCEGGGGRRTGGPGGTAFAAALHPLDLLAVQIARQPGLHAAAAGGRREVREVAPPRALLLVWARAGRNEVARRRSDRDC
eukprot:TRINITY_DN5910_c0_g1_i2.p1 TRINITY_DN5910_c0_g1~~TRINITY_DN5910_c0_g1_i2.p1  ORF type:complete len:429 (-),score=66.14 TRINITY_DN5910_c0_g1_i2:9-1235(-)